VLLDVFYSVYKSDTAELRIGGGLHAFDFEVELAADAFIGDASASRVAADEQLLAPLPNLRFDGLYALSPRWSVSGGMGWLSVTYDDYEGSYVFADIKTDYRITDGFSLGIGYRLVDTDIKAEGSRRDLSFNSEYHGPTAYLSYSF
jgi:outer membrane receptor for ferric coprogen and ferric-rhodotorulic acid